MSIENYNYNYVLESYLSTVSQGSVVMEKTTHVTTTSINIRQQQQHEGLKSTQIENIFL
jgi:hypothetical protein